MAEFHRKLLSMINNHFNEMSSIKYKENTIEMVIEMAKTMFHISEHQMDNIIHEAVTDGQRQQQREEIEIEDDEEEEEEEEGYNEEEIEAHGINVL